MLRTRSFPPAAIFRPMTTKKTSRSYGTKQDPSIHSQPVVHELQGWTDQQRTRANLSQSNGKELEILCDKDQSAAKNMESTWTTVTTLVDLIVSRVLPGTSVKKQGAKAMDRVAELLTSEQQARQAMHPKVKEELRRQDLQQAVQAAHLRTREKREEYSSSTKKNPGDPSVSAVEVSDGNLAPNRSHSGECESLRNGSVYADSHTNSCLSALKILEVVELWNLSTSALINASTQSPVPKIKVRLQALLDPMTLVWTPVSASVYFVFFSSATTSCVPL
ncbi:uncharacterized protein PAC_14134 [Phialocephala subalpina]|uniref:Uncharacterized protein n=1 Tax=Phialocephala subalpina TaxID=576137 RepID=A0A1L7XGZ8_9HELO|nr:uncharacterized protein PAC_14134 [Phialocephala subalpina]